MLSEEQKASMKLDIIILQNIANDLNYSLDDRLKAARQAQIMVDLIYDFKPNNKNENDKEQPPMR